MNVDLPVWVFVRVYERLENEENIRSVHRRRLLLRGWRDFCDDLRAMIVDNVRFHPHDWPDFYLDEQVTLSDLEPLDLLLIREALRAEVDAARTVALLHQEDVATHEEALHDIIGYTETIAAINALIHNDGDTDSGLGR